ncbi:MAG: hypothetical protein J0H06_10430, partial [Actinobacteria bacterium]|nr:hypothetical protein [Actinomycetota bacterium]
VILATYTYENSRLLLLSRSRAFPDGLANNGGEVGRHFSTHCFLADFGLFPGRKTNLWSGTGAQATAVDDFNGDNFDHAGLGFVGGSVMMACHEIRPMLNHRLLPPSVPRWGAARKQWLRENFESIGFAYALPDALTYEDHDLTLDPSVRDPYGVPVVRVTYRLRDNERRQAEFLAGRLDRWMLEAGAASESWHSPIGVSPVSTHAYGGTRMGTDPAASVVDPWGFAHEVPNLAVAGASCFPGGGGVNPTETVEALTWRTVDRLLAKLG